MFIYMEVTLSFPRQRSGGMTSLVGMYIMSQNDKCKDMGDREVEISEVSQENVTSCLPAVQSVATNS